MENLHIDNKNDGNGEVKTEKQTKIAFSGKVLPSTSQEFESLFEGMTKSDGTKLQFEDKLQMLIDAASEKFADDKLQLEEKVKNSLEFDLKEEKAEIETIIDSLHTLVNSFERKANKQLSTFKNTISNEAITKAQKNNQNTINLLSDFEFQNAKLKARNDKLTRELGEKEEELATTKEQLMGTGIEYARASELLEKTKTENIELKVELEDIKNQLSSIKEKFNAQLQKNDTLRDEKETLEKTLADINEKHNQKINSLQNEIAELKAINTELNNNKMQLETNLNMVKAESTDLKTQLENAFFKAVEKDALINELKTDVKVSAKEIELLTVNLDELKETKIKLEQENKELNNSLKDLEVDHKMLIDNNRETLTIMKKLEEENKGLQNKIDDLKENK